MNRLWSRSKNEEKVGQGRDMAYFGRSRRRRQVEVDVKDETKLRSKSKLRTSLSWDRSRRCRQVEVDVKDKTKLRSKPKLRKSQSWGRSRRSRKVEGAEKLKLMLRTRKSWGQSQRWGQVKVEVEIELFKATSSQASLVKVDCVEKGDSWIIDGEYLGSSNKLQWWQTDSVAKSIRVGDVSVPWELDYGIKKWVCIAIETIEWESEESGIVLVL